MPSAGAEATSAEPGMARDRIDRIERALDGSMRALRDALERRTTPTRRAA